MIRVEWEDEERLVSCPDDVERILDELDGSCREGDAILVNIELTQTGDSLAIGVGKDRSVLNFVSGSGDAPYFSSVGEMMGDECVVFRFMGEWTEFPLSSTIPKSDSREAMRQFCLTGTRPACVDWVED